MKIGYGPSVLRCGAAALWLVAMMTATIASADGVRTIVIRTVSPEQAFRESFERGDHADALRHIDRAIDSRPKDPLLLYNRACVMAALDQPDEAAETLLDAVRHGFNAFSHMQRDPDLRPIRDHRIFTTILRARRAADEILAERKRDEWRETLGGNAVERADARHRLHFMTTQPQDALDAAVRATRAHLDVLNDRLFDEPDGLQCLIVLPSNERGRSLLPHANAHGNYRHHAGVLIALDADRSLRHELVHLLHHRHMDELGQQHPIWIQEGLAALFERYELRSDGSIAWQPGERLNLARRLAADGRLLSWRDLFACGDRSFNREAHRLYAQVDSIFSFIAAEGDLREWYRLYIAHFEVDASGRLALERHFDCAIDEIESRWLQWLHDQPIRVGSGEVAIRRPRRGGE